VSDDSLYTPHDPAARPADHCAPREASYPEPDSSSGRERLPIACMPRVGVAPHPDIPLGLYTHVASGEPYAVIGGVFEAAATDATQVLYVSVRDRYWATRTIANFLDLVPLGGDTNIVVFAPRFRRLQKFGATEAWLIVKAFADIDTVVADALRREDARPTKTPPPVTLFVENFRLRDNELIQRAFDRAGAAAGQRQFRLTCHHPRMGSGRIIHLNLEEATKDGNDGVNYIGNQLEGLPDDAVVFIEPYPVSERKPTG
jgi:hypothetical protein